MKELSEIKNQFLVELAKLAIRDRDRVLSQLESDFHFAVVKLNDNGIRSPLTEELVGEIHEVRKICGVEFP